MASPPDGSERVERERDFHNVVFAEHSRAPLARFYTVQQRAFDTYEGLLAETPDGGSVLEYGCGPGSWAHFLARRGCHVTGIDISDVAIEKAREAAEAEGLGDRCTFMVMDAERTTFDAGSFDLVCGAAILHHLDLDVALPEIARLLRPGGRGAFVEALGHNPLINLYRRRTPQHRTTDEHPLRLEDLRLAERHFRSVDTSFFNFLTLLAVPLRDRPGFPGIVARLDAVDQALFRTGPLWRLAWTGVISLSGPMRTG